MKLFKINLFRDADDFCLTCSDSTAEARAEHDLFNRGDSPDSCRLIELPNIYSFQS